MKTLYLGLRPPDSAVTHYPIIKIVPRSPETPGIKLAFQEMPLYTHIILTSQSAVELFFHNLKYFHQKCTQSFIAVGQKTKNAIEEHGFTVSFTAEEETSEGIVQLLQQVILDEAYLFWPHSALSRSILPDYFQEQKIRFRSCILYDTKPHRSGPLPNLDAFDEIIFTSPSTVSAFLLFYKALPKNKQLTASGPITKKALKQSLAIC